ncbi:MAG: hypothetical protein RML36_15380 [Anaerolineae bacterium]|nr:hypothetical protein [Anaerolineae bacterium]
MSAHNWLSAISCILQSFQFQVFVLSSGLSLNEAIGVFIRLAMAVLSSDPHGRIKGLTPEKLGRILGIPSNVVQALLDADIARRTKTGMSFPFIVRMVNPKLFIGKSSGNLSGSKAMNKDDLVKAPAPEPAPQEYTDFFRALIRILPKLMEASCKKNCPVLEVFLSFLNDITSDTTPTKNSGDIATTESCHVPDLGEEAPKPKPPQGTLPLWEGEAWLNEAGPKLQENSSSITSDCQAEKGKVTSPDTSKESGSEEAILVFPCRGTKRYWALTPSLLNHWQELYQELDVLAEAKKALAWVSANVNRRKTARGMPRFLVAWFNRAIDRGRWKTIPASATKQSIMDTLDAMTERSPEPQEDPPHKNNGQAPFEPPQHENPPEEKIYQVSIEQGPHGLRRFPKVSIREVHSTKKKSEEQNQPAQRDPDAEALKAAIRKRAAELGLQPPETTDPQPIGSLIVAEEPIQEQKPPKRARPTPKQTIPVPQLLKVIASYIPDFGSWLAKFDQRTLESYIETLPFKVVDADAWKRACLIVSTDQNPFPLQTLPRRVYREYQRLHSIYRPPVTD